MQGYAAAVSARASGRLCLLALAAVVVALPSTGRADSLEYKVKAEFLERFTRFVEWPSGSFAAADSPFVLCVIGDNPFGGYLDQMSQTRKIQNRKISNRVLKAATEVDGCHLVFIARGAPVQQVLTRTTGRPALTVGDSPGFSEAGVLINFLREKEHVRFEINGAAVKKSGLKFSSKLLDLGRKSGEQP